MSCPKGLKLFNKPPEPSFSHYYSASPKEYTEHGNYIEGFENTGQIMPVEDTTPIDPMYDKMYHIARVPCAHSQEHFVDNAPLPPNRVYYPPNTPFDFPCDGNTQKFNNIAQFYSPISAYAVDNSLTDIAGRTVITPRVKDDIPRMLKVNVPNKDFLNAHFCHQPNWSEKCA